VIADLQSALFAPCWPTTSPKRAEQQVAAPMLSESTGVSDYRIVRLRGR
jgi:hypothetical protein